MKKDKKSVKSILIAIIVILSIICTISIIYNFNGGFYYSRIVEYYKILGEGLEININQQGTEVVACNFSGTNLLNTDIKQEVTIKTADIQAPLYLRAKTELIGATMQENIMFGYANWVTSEDGYMYFKQTITSNEKIGLCKYVRLSDNNKLETNINYILAFIVEASTTPFITT